MPTVALAKLVDRLLASPHFGERWARHWMDVVRFTETHGNEWNYEVHHAWRYRDYLIRAFNDDVPYDQFVREHIAGDLLPKPRWNAKEKFNESVIGTAFYRFGEVNHDDCVSLRQIGYDLLDNQIDTLSKAFQAMTVACARCHDHKLDAVSMRDYYGLLGILRSSRCVSHTIDAPDVNADFLSRDARQEKTRFAENWPRPGCAKSPCRRPNFRPRPLNGSAARPHRPGDRSGPPGKMARGAGGRQVAAGKPAHAWRLLVAAQQKDKASFADAWKKLGRAIREGRCRAHEFQPKNFTTLADFRQETWPDWQVGGQGLRDKPSRSGDLVDRDGRRRRLCPPSCRRAATRMRCPTSSTARCVHRC